MVACDNNNMGVPKRAAAKALIAACLLISPTTPAVSAAEKPSMSRSSQSEQAPPGMTRVEIRDDRRSVQALLSAASRAGDEGRFDQAEAHYARALDIAERVLGLNDGDTLRTINNLGVFYTQRGRYDEAELFLERAIEGRQRAFGAEHPQTLTAMNNLATLYGMIGRVADAEPLLLQVLEARERVSGPDHPNTLGVINNLAFSYSRQGRYAEAEPLYLRVLEASERTLGWDNRNTIISADNLAILYNRQQRYAEAEPLFLRVQDAATRTLGANHRTTLTSVNNLAAMYDSQRRYDEAEPLYVRAMEGSIEALGADHPGTLISMDNLASLYDNQRRYVESERLRLQVLEISERVLGPNHFDTLITVNNLAVLYDRQGRNEEADPLYARTLAGERALLGETHPSTIQTANDLTALRLELGDAIGALEPASLLLNGLRRRRSETVSSSFGEAQLEREEADQGETFALFADTVWAAGEATNRNLSGEAFEALQDAMAGTANRAIIRMAIRRFADEAGEGLGALVRQREELSNRWATNNESYGLSMSDARSVGEQDRASARTERAEIEAAIELIDARLREEFPDYFALIRPEGLSVEETQAMLGPNEAILLTMPTDRGTHIMAISRESFGWAQSGWTIRQIEAAVRRLRWEVGANVELDPEEEAAWLALETPGSPFPFDRSTAFALYNAVVAPVAEALSGMDHVFVAAGGPLSGLPFSILVTEEPEGDDNDPAALRATRWFADAHALTHIPSVQSLHLLRRFEQVRGRATGFAGFGDPVLDGQAQSRGLNRGARALDAATVLARSGGGVANVRALRSMARLPGTAVELENMRQALDAPENSIWLAERATEAAVKEADLSTAGILAFATHGLMAGEISAFAEPGLVFTPPDTASELDDGYLAASEVSALRLNADWVILSACNTATGEGGGSQGLSGLARAFFYAGARNLLASYWPVNDDVAARLTVRTIALRQADDELSRARAFQQAMREVRDDASHDTAQTSWSHPAFWAPFTLIGDGGR